MDISGALDAIKKAIDNTHLGNSTGIVAGIWGVIRVCMPVIREWIAARQTTADRLKNDNAATYKVAFENAATQSIEDHDAWDKERARYESEIAALKSRRPSPGDNNSHEN